MADSLRTATQLLHAFGKAAVEYPDAPRILAFLNAARSDGLVTVPSSFIPRNNAGQPIMGSLTLGGNSKTILPNAAFYGLGGAQLESIDGPVNVGFVLYGRRNDEAVATFRELGGEAGVIVHVSDSTGGVSRYDNPLALWSLIVYATLQGSSWLSRIAEITENPAYHFNPFTASVEALKRLLAAPPDRQTATPAFSLLDRFPATPAGHVAFLEFVRDEVRGAAEAKRRQLERGYSTATLESMVRGIKWHEAQARLNALSTVSGSARSILADILHRELSAGTVEQVDALLAPAIAAVRDSFEQARIEELASKLAIVETAGDLWKAYSERKRPCLQTSAISFRPGANTPTMTCPDAAAEARRNALDRAQALVTLEGGDKAVAMERLIARAQLATGMDKASVVNLALADFVAAAMGHVRVNDSPAGMTKADDGDVIERLIAGPVDAELSPRELALVEAYLKQPVSLAQLKREAESDGKLESAQRRNKLKLICDFNRKLRAANPEGVQREPLVAAAVPDSDAPVKLASDTRMFTKAKRSTERGEGQAKLIAALTKHHKYSDGGCLNLEPIGNNELARLAEVDRATASAFFKQKFKGHASYKVACGDPVRLATALKLLNGEFAPHLLYGRQPPHEDDERDEE